jgi:hypothetical protein
VAGRGEFTIDGVDTDRGTAVAVCAAVFEVVGATMAWATIDAYSDYRDTMPADVQDAEQVLRAIGARRTVGERRRFWRRTDPGMGIDVPRTDEAGWAAVRTYTPWSINAEFLDADGTWIATVHDCALSITLSLSPDQAAALSGRLDGATMAPLARRRR